ncbi:formate dehydrogenase subunit delta [Pseudonocardia spinosispora]|uniref:formate dehydrogenase subunit delta n=1 Tax=Pseudonocardia spinosispora TaxID=103441 RepID=UPI0003F67461|nr:formate dehydrogenase subunit delta [Pseudonocardia spinosispora]
MIRHSTVEPVVRLAGEIAVQFAHRPVEESAPLIAEHIRKFWDPRMRAALHAAVDRGDELDPAAVAAVALLERPG